MPNPIESIKNAISQRPDAEQQELLRWLRERHPIHKLESEFGAPAEVILEAISRASDLSRRGVLGLIAEASFKVNVVDALAGWHDEPVIGDLPYDFQLVSAQRRIRIQVKRQRLVKGVPMRFRANPQLFVAETQRSRRGVDPKTGEDTRPYRFGEFDLLAVCMQPTTGSWSDFRFTRADWLLPRPQRPDWISVLQPVSLEPNEDWTDSLLTAIEWLDLDRIRPIEM